MALPDWQGQGVDDGQQAITLGHGGGATDIAQPQNNAAMVTGEATDRLETACAVGGLDGHGEAVVPGAGAKRLKGGRQVRGILVGEAGHQVIEAAAGRQAQPRGEVGRHARLFAAHAPATPDPGAVAAKSSSRLISAACRAASAAPHRLAANSQTSFAANAIPWNRR
ncbi:MAG: hypothetical protein VCB77_08360 [Alphaproteobacteria bacterium]